MDNIEMSVCRDQGRIDEAILYLLWNYLCCNNFISVVVVVVVVVFATIAFAVTISYCNFTLNFTPSASFSLL